MIARLMSMRPIHAGVQSGAASPSDAGSLTHGQAGTVFRSAFGVLRTAEKPTQEIADGMLAKQDLTNVDIRLLRDLTGAVKSSFRNHKGGTAKGAAGRSEH